MLSGLVQYDWLVLWYESLHYCPTNEVSNSTDAEDNHVACRLTSKPMKVKASPWVSA